MEGRERERWGNGVNEVEGGGGGGEGMRTGRTWPAGINAKKG